MDVTSTDLLVRHFNLYHEAARLAALADYRVRVGAVISKGRRVICGSFNTVRNDQKNVPYGHATTHAEMNVMRMLPESYSGKCTLYIARKGKSNLHMPSRPCNRCMLALKEQTVIREIVYLNDNLKVVLESLF